MAGHEIENPEAENRAYQSRLVHTYFVKPLQESAQDDANEILRQFWEIEKVPNKEEYHMSIKEKAAVKLMEQLLAYKDSRFEVSLPQKDNPAKLTSKYQMALNRLRNTKKRLIKDPALGSSYSEVLHQYEDRGYIRKIGSATDHQTGWYLSHFLAIRKDKVTSKTRIAFDASAKQSNIALNDIVHQG